MENRQISCKNGHYYDKSLGECPSCKSSTVLLNIGTSDKKNKSYKSKDINSKTVYMPNYQESQISTMDKNPINEIEERKEVVLAGWLVIISKQGKGMSFDITFGFNNIGKDSNNHISIQNKDNLISKEKHASIIYDYSNNIYFLKHEDGKYLTYLNGSLVLEVKELKGFDKIKVGNTQLLFVPLCGKKFKWKNSNEKV